LTAKVLVNPRKSPATTRASKYSRSTDLGGGEVIAVDGAGHCVRQTIAEV
jgi:hypothetical protein